MADNIIWNGFDRKFSFLYNLTEDIEKNAVNNNEVEVHKINQCKPTQKPFNKFYILLGS